MQEKAAIREPIQPQGLFDWRDPEKLSEKRPQFVPVCVNGEMKAALVHAPTVTIEEFE